MLATFQFATGKLISRSLMHPGVSYSSSGLQSSSTLAQYGFELKKWRCSCIPANPKTLGGFEKLLADKIHRVLGLSRCISSWSEPRYALNLCSDTWMIHFLCSFRFASLAGCLPPELYGIIDYGGQYVESWMWKGSRWCCQSISKKWSALCGLCGLNACSVCWKIQYSTFFRLSWGVFRPRPCSSAIW